VTGDVAAIGIWLVLGAVVLALVVPVVRRAELAVGLLAVAGFALLVSPTSWSHHYVWIAPALLVTVVQAVRQRSTGVAVVAVGLALAFMLAPFQFLPIDDGRELMWSGPQQIVGATYVIITLALLAALRWRHRRVPE
jgi:alpha-1,2-mannosyltransferase